MKSFRVFLLEKRILSFNILIESTVADIPGLKINFSGINALERLLSNAYEKEFRIQSRYGGIRNPPTVIVNKIRHLFTNYDEIRDKITSTYMSKYEEARLLSVLIEQVSKLVDDIIEMIKFPFFVKKNMISKEDLLKSNHLYARRELEKLKL